MHRLHLVQYHIVQDKFVYSVPVGPKRKGETQIHRHPASRKNLLLIPQNFKNLSSFWDDTLVKHSLNLALQGLTFQDVDRMAKSLGSWLLSNKHQKIYLYSKNRVEWTVSDIACWNYGIVNVPLYDTFGNEAFSHIIKLTSGTIIFTTNDLTSNLYDNLSKNKYSIHTVVYFDSPCQKNIKKLTQIGLTVLKFTDLLQHEILQRPQVGLDHHLTYNFTSGTTGLPKGVISTHRVTISQCLAMKGHLDFQPTDVHLSFLPIAHIIERFINWTVIYYGGNIKYANFHITEVTKDFARVKPTILTMVPRLMNKFYPLCKEMILSHKSNKLVKELFGGRVRIIVTGGAPTAPEILQFFKSALDCDVREGYGQTETTAIAFMIYLGDTNYGHVGGPNVAVQLKLVDVPSMNYLSTDNPPRGQICTRGGSVFKGYYKDEKNNKQTIDEEGWNHSGDIGIILPNGSLKIIDRKKNIYKLSQGQYVAPEKIQNIYLRCPYVAQCFIYGHSLKDFNVAVIHPNIDVLYSAAKSMGITQASLQEIVKNKELERYVLKQMTEHGRKQELHGFQLAKRLKISPVSFGSLGIFTNFMKLQRNIAKQVFQQPINQMYLEIVED